MECCGFSLRNVSKREEQGRCLYNADVFFRGVCLGQWQQSLEDKGGYVVTKNICSFTDSNEMGLALVQYVKKYGRKRKLLDFHDIYVELATQMI